MSAAKLNLLIEQGADFSQRFIWKDSDQNPIDLTGYTARMQIREKIESDTVLLELTTENGRITLNQEPGTIDLKINSLDSESLPEGKSAYDLELVSSTNFVTRLLKGGVDIDPEVTR